MAKHLIVIAACTERKRGELRDELRLRSVAAGDASTRAAEWWNRLMAAQDASKARAAEVYLGEYWQLVRQLPITFQRAGWSTELWVASAGYGLLHESDRIAPYSCTFTAASLDDVAFAQPSRERVRFRQQWWQVITRLAAECGRPGSLAALARRRRDAAVLVLASPGYVKALQPDLAAAAQCLRRRAQLVVVTSGAGWACEELRDRIVAVDDRVRDACGGTMQAIHVRAVLAMLGRERAPEDLQLSAEELRGRYESMIGFVQRRRRPSRLVLTDNEVIAYIEHHLRREPNKGWSTLLRQLRDSGKACEQMRFRKLYAELAAAEQL